MKCYKLKPYCNIQQTIKHLDTEDETVEMSYNKVVPFPSVAQLLDEDIRPFAEGEDRVLCMRADNGTEILVEVKDRRVVFVGFPVSQLEDFALKIFTWSVAGRTFQRYIEYGKHGKAAQMALMFYEHYFNVHDDKGLAEVLSSCDDGANPKILSIAMIQLSEFMSVRSEELADYVYRKVLKKR